VYCSAGSSPSASWPQAQAGALATFTCASGYSAANPSVVCLQSGSAASYASDPCTVIPSASNDSNSPAGAMVGGVLGGLVGLAALAVLAGSSL